MIKKQLSILLLIIFILLLSGCKKSLIDVKDLDSITLKPNAFLSADTQTYTLANEKSPFKFITDLLEGALSQPIITDHQNKNDFILELGYSDQASRVFSLDFDLAQQTAYLTEGEKTYSITTEKYNGLIASDVFKPLLQQDFQVPELKFLMNDEIVSYIGNGTFDYRSFNQTKKSLTYKTESTTLDEIVVNSNSGVTINYTLNQKPTKMVENIYQEGTLLKSFPLTDHTLILPTEEGHFTIELSLTWENLATEYFDGEATYQFTLSNDLPVSFMVTQNVALPGDCFVITAQNVNEGQVLNITAPFLEKEITFIPYKDYYIGIIPLYAWIEPQNYTLTASTVEPLTGLEVSSEFPVEVTYKYFDVQHLTVSADTLALQSQENIDSDAALVKEARSISTPEKLWVGTFLQPVEGVITTEYSQTRYTNDNPTPSRHSGIDIATARGTPVKASNNGIVTLSMMLYLTGNTVIIDHGMGIFTAYGHLDECLVEKGDVVEIGDIIGKIGTTGFSTGPHLHFTCWINGTYVNPWTFFEKDILDF